MTLFSLIKSRAKPVNSSSIIHPSQVKIKKSAWEIMLFERFRPSKPIYLRPPRDFDF